MRAAASGSGVATSTSTTWRPRSSSRTAPPTTYASTPATAVRMRLSIDDAPLRAPWIAHDPGRHLVVDRSQVACMLLRPESVAEERYDRPFRLVLELDRERVH